MQLDWGDGKLAEGLALYRAGEFFAAHEAWESVWLVSPEPQKTFLQGLIQVAAAFHHWERNNPQGTALLLEAALRRLQSLPKEFEGICVTVLCNDIRERLDALTAEPPVASLTSARIQIQ